MSNFVRGDSAFFSSYVVTPGSKNRLKQSPKTRLKARANVLKSHSDDLLHRGLISSTCKCSISPHFYDSRPCNGYLDVTWATLTNLLKISGLRSFCPHIRAPMAGSNKNAATPPGEYLFINRGPSPERQASPLNTKSRVKLILLLVAHHS